MYMIKLDFLGQQPPWWTEKITRSEQRRDIPYKPIDGSAKLQYIFIRSKDVDFIQSILFGQLSYMCKIPCQVLKI